MPKYMLPENNELSWLYMITKNQTIDYLRKKRNNIDLDDIYDIQDKNSKIQEIVDIDYYNRIISGLDEKEKEILSLKILSKFTFKEIGKILNIPTATVQWRYYKSIHTLKLLISNLALLIISITLFIKNTNSNILEENKSNNIKKSDNSEIKSEEEGVADDNVKDDNVKMEGSSSFENLKLQESIGISSDSTKNVDTPKIITLSFSFIFLIFSIIFGIIYIKHKKKK